MFARDGTRVSAGANGKILLSPFLGLVYILFYREVNSKSVYYCHLFRYLYIFFIIQKEARQRFSISVLWCPHTYTHTTLNYLYLHFD